MAAKGNNVSAASPTVSTSKKQQKSRQWTETELKYFALVLVDEKNEFAYRLDTLALKKTASKIVFEEISTELEEIMLGEDFKDESLREHCSSKSRNELLPLNIDAEKLRIKFKWMKDQWRKYTDRIKKGSGKSPIQEPEWYTIINAVFSDTHGNLEIASKARDVLSDDSESDVSNSEDTELVDIEEGWEADHSDVSNNSNLPKGSDSGTECDTKKKLLKKGLEAKPLPRRKRIRTQGQAINEITKSFKTMGESQQRRSEIMMQAENERHTEFIAFQREQAELNRQHELKMLEVIMKHSNRPSQQQPPHQQQPPRQSPLYIQLQVQPTQLCSSVPYSQNAIQNMQASERQDDILNLDSQNNQPSMRWF
ncbi:Hypothetical predicted protein [Paramuricea clavata]|uniref:Uncharacterized protein n=1 Tax=Paramuricea clavata TaxID=317549 RepID=A0A7D9JLN4_PARCT|nr:Hypothetical predicted protein [Paramuricea clavata]